MWSEQWTTPYDRLILEWILNSFKLKHFSLVVYVDVDNAKDGKLFLSVITKVATSRAYNIRVSQLKGNEAPFNCLQYYTEPEGWIQTFNYEDASKYVEFRNPSYFVSQLKIPLNFNWKSISKCSELI